MATIFGNLFKAKPTDSQKSRFLGVCAGEWIDDNVSSLGGEDRHGRRYYVPIERRPRPVAGVVETKGQGLRGLFDSELVGMGRTNIIPNNSDTLRD
jgi:hypothetical protein